MTDNKNEIVWKERRGIHFAFFNNVQVACLSLKHTFEDKNCNKCQYEIQIGKKRWRNQISQPLNKAKTKLEKRILKELESINNNYKIYFN